MDKIDINFDVYSDTPEGRDPDSYSPTLRRYHKKLWSKALPSGRIFNLSDNSPRVLQHKSAIGSCVLSSDSISHTYSRVKSMDHIVKQVPRDEINCFFSISSTIGGYIIFPSKKINKKMTINGSRGINSSIKDRFDLTLECIRLFYLDEKSPLTDTFNRYTTFFELFEDFRGYVKFFLLQDLVNEDCSTIKFAIPFKDFSNRPLPKDLNEYQLYKKNMIKFVKSRNQRILKEV